jgi:ABC-type transport system involved in multi-copper enzyme maturation permease subunit
MNPTPAISRPAAPAHWEPSFLGALRGLWIFTWRSRLGLRKLPLLLLTLAAIPTLTFLTVDPSEVKTFVEWAVSFYLVLIVPLCTLAVFGPMIRDELQADTLGFLITRPLTRARLYLLKYLCHLAWVQAALSVHLLLLVLVGVIRQIPGIWSMALWLFATQFLAIIAYGALSGLLGLLHQRYMVLGLLYGFFVELGIGRIPTNINSLSIAHHVRTLLANEETIRDINDWVPDGTLKSVLIMFVATALFLAGGAALFTYREYHSSDEMQK